MQSDYQLALNTTVYYANILSNTPLNTPVYRIRAIINAPLIEILVLQLRTGQNNESDLFEFEGGINERITKSDSELVYIGSKRVVDAVINLVADPSMLFETENYPIQLGFDILLIVFLPGEAIQAISRGLGTIKLPLGKERYLDENGAPILPLLCHGKVYSQ